MYYINLPEKKTIIIIDNYKMIYQSKIQTLTELELAVLLYACNEVFETNVKVDQHTVTAYKQDAFEAKLRAAKQYVKPEHTEFFINLCSKLGIDV